MIADYHVHTPYCGHAHGNIIQYIESAIQAGLQEIGFTDHLGRYYLTRSQKRRYWDWGMDERNFARYVSELSDLRDVYEDQIAVKIGLEVDYVEGAEELLSPFLTHFPLDFSICSIHCIPRFGWKHLSNYPKASDSSHIYREYFRLARSAIQCGLFQSLAHIDFIWRYLPWPALHSEHNEAALNELVQTITTAASNDHCLEINANGFIWSQINQHTEFNPFLFMLQQAHKHSVPVTIGSDAHDPQMVGKAFPELISLLHEHEIHTIRCFSDGKGSTNQLG